MSEQRTTTGNGAQGQHVAVRQSQPMNFGLVPQNMDEAVRLAKALSQAKGMPEYLHGDVATCLMVVEQAMRWRMSAFAVAQCASNVKGKLMFEGKLVAAAVETSGIIEGYLDYTFKGAGDDRTITVSARRRGEAAPRAIDIRLGDVRTTNEWWKKQPDQQLVYSGARNWARRWAPAVMLGVYSPEEWGRDIDKVVDQFDGQTIEGNAGTDDAEVAEGRQQAETEPPPPKEQPRRTWATLLDEIEADAAAAQTMEDIAELGRDDRATLIAANGSAAVQHRLASTLTFHRSRLQAPVDDGSSAAEPEPEDDPLADELPEGWTKPPPDSLGQEAAQLIAAYRAAPNLGALEAIRTVSTGTMITMQALLKAERHNELRQIEAAYAARRAELAPG